MLIERKRERKRKGQETEKTRQEGRRRIGREKGKATKKQKQYIFYDKRFLNNDEMRIEITDKELRVNELLFSIWYLVFFNLPLDTLSTLSRY